MIPSNVLATGEPWTRNSVSIGDGVAETRLPFRTEVTNHIGTVHATAIFGLGKVVLAGAQRADESYLARAVVMRDHRAKPLAGAHPQHRGRGRADMGQDAQRTEVAAGDVRMIHEIEQLRLDQEQMSDPFYQQAFLPGMGQVEQEQFERNVDALRRRLQEIPKEIEQETAEIKARFADPQPRMFPVAVTILVPERLAK